MRIIERPTRQTRRPAPCAAPMMLSILATLEAKQAAATLPFSAGDQRRQRSAHVGLRSRLAVDEDVGRVAHHGQHARVAESANGGGVGYRASERIRVDLPVAVCRIVPSGVRIARPLGSGMEWVRVIRCRSNGPSRISPSSADLGDRRRVHQPVLTQLLAQQIGGERRGVDRRLETRPQPGDRADVVLVGVGDHDAEDVIGMLLDEGRVGQDDFDAGRRLVAEGDAQVDDDPCRAHGGP